MKRKVVQHGPSTLTISLPAEWARKNNVKPGDELDIVDEQNNLSVRLNSGHVAEKRAKIDFGEISVATAQSVLTVLYKSGYSHIDITSLNQQVIDSIVERTNSTLVGFEVIDVSKLRCTVESYTLDEEREFDKVFRRILFVTSEILKRASAYIATRENEAEIYALEIMSNRLTSLFHRIINKKSYKDEKSIYSYHIAWIAESICDDVRDLIKHMCKDKEHMVPSSKKQLLEQISFVFQKFIETYYSFSIQEVDSLRASIIKILKEYDNLKMSNSNEAVFNMYCFSIAKRIYDCIGSTIGLHY